jgi:pimeloyl-ACP methyl ester carboxylesterase
MNPASIHYARSSDGINIAYLSLGNGPPIVFASNILGEAQLYRLALPYVRNVTDGLVACGWRVIRHDLRGMGSSDREVSDWSLDARISDLHAVVERLGLRRFALAGVDLGAATAIAYAAQHPALVSHLVLVSPWTSGARRFALPDHRMATTMTPTAGREWEVFANVLGSIATGFEDRDLGRQIADAMQRSTSPHNLAAYYAASRALDLTGLLPRLATLTLVLHDPTFPFGSFELCQEVAASVPAARLVVIEGRSIAGTAHRDYVAAIDQFLRAGAGAGAEATRPLGRGRRSRRASTRCCG